MIRKLFERMFGDYSSREIKRLMPIVEQINALEPEIQALTDAQLQAKTPEFKQRLAAGETLDDILPEAFAVVREASYRVLGMRHFDVQLLGGIVLHQGRIAEMKTGEGKTLVATLPCYLNALTGKGVHVITVNDYLAKRDSEQMGKIHRFLGLTVGLITHDVPADERRKAYNADITYGTNNEYGFDYLRDNMAIYKEQIVQQKGHNFAVVDEVDSILIDEARTPLIISGMGDKSTELYEIADRFARTLKCVKKVELDDKQFDDEIDADYLVDEKANTATLTERGVKKAEAAFNLENLSDPENMTISHHINQAIKAHGIMHRDKDYVVKDGEVIIVDEFTGRLMFGRRYNDGLHQAIEAKERVKVARESKTLATITFQNFFRLYTKLSGMTGTAETEEAEFQDIYKLDVVVIPTNKPMIRHDHGDVVYKNEAGKFNAVIRQIIECHQKGQPVLVGTVTIEKSELLSKLLKKQGIPHEVLNAKYHEKEAEIIAQAGKLGAVTISTNMAGRGTDIMLGGNAEFLAKKEMKKRGFTDEMLVEATGFSETDDEEILEARATFKQLYEQFKPEIDKEHEQVVEAGGLFIIGTERHESRRIDNQLRGRSGRQGDPGESRFYISLEDDLMRLFGSERLERMVDGLGLADDEPITHQMLTGAIENAQKRVEGRNFQIRKHVLQYDDVMNVQRNTIYSERQRVLNGENLRDSIYKMIDEFVDATIASYTGSADYPDDWNLAGLTDYVESIYMPKGALTFTREEFERLTRDKLREILLETAHARYEEKEAEFGAEAFREIERIILLQVVDRKWMDHIDNMDQLRQGIGLRAYAQRDPVIEYKEEGYNMYEEMLGAIGEDVIKFLFNVRAERKMEREAVAQPTATSHGDGTLEKKPVTKGNKVGRNDPCPCGSGKKYKKCCGMYADGQTPTE
ncbi:MAG: preprotein translocase subunit SecA [Ruminococcaceae bacterium]|nr:preprotein translocase subunit SecA [Oscillospiraceae bacterium]